MRRFAKGGLRCARMVSTPPEVATLLQALEKDPKLWESVVQQMLPESRRRLVVAGGALEWFGKEHIASEVARADDDQDKFISPKDFDKWFECALRRKAEQGRGEDHESTNATTVEAAIVPFAALVIIALEAALPFVGFGFLDNATMIVAGDAIDRSVGFYFNCSVMASAAMGNVVSGMCGMQVHGAIEKVVLKLKLPAPKLSEEQRKSQRVFLAGHLGGTLGICIGLTLGMLPLLFIRDEDEKLEMHVFRSFDKNHDGHLSEDEIFDGLKELGFPPNKEAITLFIAQRGGDSHTVDFDCFKKLCRELRKR